MDALKQSLGRNKAATSPAKRKRAAAHRGRKRKAA
jgi:hypothetical protein